MKTCGFTDLKRNPIKNRIINALFSEAGDFSWMASIRVYVNKNMKYFCGRALISNKWVLTAANCLKRLVKHQIF